MTKPLDRELKEKLIQPILSALEPMLIIELEEFAEEYIQLLTVRTPWKGKLSLENSPYMCGEWGPLWAVDLFVKLIKMHVPLMVALSQNQDVKHVVKNCQTRRWRDE